MQFQKIYQSGKTSIYDCGTFYKLKNTGGEYVCLDKNPNLIINIDSLLNGTSVHFDSKLRGFYFSDGKRFFCTLVQLIVATFMEGDFQKNLKYVKTGKVKYADPTKCNLMRKNLIFSTDNRVNEFYDDGQFFYVRHKKTGLTIKTDLDYCMNQALRKERWYPHVDNTLIARINGKRVFIYHFIKAYKYRHGDNVRNYVFDFLRLLNKAKICVDHIDTDRLNCCDSNLLLMANADNCRKSNKTKFLNTKPFVCSAIHVNDTIRTVMGYDDGNTKIISYKTFYSVNEYVNALCDFWESGIIETQNGKKALLPEKPKGFKTETRQQSNYFSELYSWRYGLNCCN